MTAPLDARIRVPLRRGGPTIALRGRRPPVSVTDGPGVPVLCVHGSTFPGHAVFDLRLDGASWLDLLADRGFWTWSLDLPGYGESDRPAALSRPPNASAPVVRTAEAVAATRAACEAILARTGADRISLFGWSWGTTICAALAAERSTPIDRLVLFGPQWIHDTLTLLAPGSTTIGSYRRVTMADARARRLRGVPEHEQARLVPPDWLDAWEAALLASDPEADRHDPPTIRAPNGTIQDSLDHWCVGEPLYDPAAVRVPTLLLVGEWDRETTPTQARGLFSALTAAPARRLVEIGRAGHCALLDRRRREVLRMVADFLAEPFPDEA